MRDIDLSKGATLFGELALQRSLGHGGELIADLRGVVLG